MSAQMGNPGRMEAVKASLRSAPRLWLVTGCAGFIGSNLLEALLALDQRVLGLDNFSSGKRANLYGVREAVGARRWNNFTLIEGDLRDRSACRQATAGVQIVLHQAARGSVPRSVEDPLATHETNASGFLNLLLAARDAGAENFVYASSSAVYGNDAGLPKREDCIGTPLSPYAASKFIDELYAGVFANCYGFHSIGLRYFNVFGKRQDPEGSYAAVIPRWIAAMLAGQPISIHGDGETSRDFCHVENVVQANLLAAVAPPASRDHIYNVAAGGRTSLRQLAQLIRQALLDHGVAYELAPLHQGFRPGDIRHSHAELERARQLLGYCPTHTVEQGLALTVAWYLNQIHARAGDLPPALPVNPASGVHHAQHSFPI
jgi:UDP-N-acetylglucosamine 4-epimerase